MILFAKIALGVAGVGLAGAGVLCSEGLVQVKVHEKSPEGVHFYVIAPAMLAPIAVHFAPRHALVKGAAKLQANLPAIRAALGALRDSDDMVFVNVTEPGTHVEIAKSHGSIVVDVDDPDTIVHVSAPIGALSITVEQLADAAPPAHSPAAVTD